jgi:hypothetical protein
MTLTLVTEVSIIPGIVKAQKISSSNAFGVSDRPKAKRIVKSLKKDGQRMPKKILNKNLIVQRPGAVRSELGKAELQFIPKYLLLQLVN